MITSGCTGWEPNKARLLTATSILGEWKQLPNPCVGEKADKTFGDKAHIFSLCKGRKTGLFYGRWLASGEFVGFTLYLAAYSI